MNGTRQDRLPVASLLALAMAAFITILTEALPAGLLPQMAQGLVLLRCGPPSALGIWITGVLTDRHLRALTLASIALFALSTLMLGVAADAPALVYAAVAVWGLAFGGAATLLQTAIAHTAG